VAAQCPQTAVAASVATNPDNPVKVLILWTHWSGYMDACARELQHLLSCELDIVCLQGQDANSPFADEEFFSYPCGVHTLNANSLAYLQARSYDLVLICSWHIKEYRVLARSSRRHSVRVLCMDNQWFGSARQYLGIAAFRVYLRSLYDFAFVPGGRQARFATCLGFQPREIIEGHLACGDGFLPAAEGKRPRCFLFAGQLVPWKGIHELASAWQLYVGRNSDPWRLKVCGTGPLLDSLKGLPSTELLGFIQPSQLPEVMNQATALVLPSLRDAWGVVVHEAAQAGLGLIVSSACGAADYFLRDGMNGRLVPPGDPKTLCEALEWFHQSDERLQRVGERSVRLAAQRTPLSWACAVSRALALGRTGSPRTALPGVTST
jgi:glycosyltransferase involved in cell wall biosynthesis